MPEDNYYLEEILKGCRKHNASSQKELYKYCFAAMMRICIRYNKNTDDAAACYNASMMKVLSRIAQYKGDGPFLGWVRMVVVNTCISEIKSRARFDYKYLDEIGNDNLLTANPEESLDAGDILSLVQQLPASYSAVFNMYVMEGYSHQEIGKILNIPEGTSKWYLYESRKILKERIQQFYYTKTTCNEGQQ